MGKPMNVSDDLVAFVETLFGIYRLEDLRAVMKAVAYCTRKLDRRDAGRLVKVRIEVFPGEGDACASCRVSVT